jgi:hypothetical protein
MQNVLTRVRNPSLRQGLLFGIILGIIMLALSFIITNFYITLALILIAAFLAGRRASQETGRMTTGTLGGLWTGLIGTFIPSLILMVLFLINIEAYRKNAQAAADQQHLHITYTNTVLLEGLLINFLFLLILGILFGLLGGLVGGSFGRRRTQSPVEEYQEAMFVHPSELQTVESTVETPSDLQTEEAPTTPPSVLKAEESSTATISEEPSSSTQPAE